MWLLAAFEDHFKPRTVIHVGGREHLGADAFIQVTVIVRQEFVLSSGIFGAIALLCYLRTLVDYQ